MIHLKKSIIQLILIAICIIVYTNTIKAQSLTQTIKGKVVDNETQLELPGANIIVVGTNPSLGVISDISGAFKIAAVPIGRYTIQVSFVGYETTSIPEVLVSSGKEVVLNITMKQSINQLNEVTVKAYSRKDKPLNTMATVSARSFTVEEARRYAGGLDDPARMASAFAGIAVGNIQDNAIIIRGNAPKGVSWRLEGVEIPNPNHFAGGNVAGGGFVTIFSSQMLANSDFFTAAFPAEYGNALAGVFDMKLRNGNSEKYEHTIQIGMMGTDISSEGPIIKGKNATYLFNYRYSTTGILSKMGLIPSEQVPQYQDLSFKLNFPTQHAGTFSIWAIGGKDNNKEPDEKDSTKWKSSWDRINYDWNISMGALGLSHKYTIGSKTFINSSIVASGTDNNMNEQRLDDKLIRRPESLLNDKSGKITLTSTLTHKFDARNTLKLGFDYNELIYSLDLNSTKNEVPETYQNFVNEKGKSSLVKGFVQYKYDITPQLSVNTGVNASYFALNQNYSIDPRVGARWEFTQGHALSLGYGKHSQLEELKFYFINTKQNNQTYYPNKNLDYSQSQHFVIGYDWLINENVRLKIEPYFQYLYRNPGIADSSFSMINFKQDWSFRESLINNTKGRNIGIDITLERFLKNNFYYLATASIFESKYKGGDGIWRNTMYNKSYTFNFLFGKEFFLKRDKILGINTRLNILGGDRRSPIDEAQSIKEKRVIADETKAFSLQEDPTYYLDLTITYRSNKKRYSGVWALQIKNLLGAPMQEGYSYNYRTNKIDDEKTVMILPSLSYKIEF